MANKDEGVKIFCEKKCSVQPEGTKVLSQQKYLSTGEEVNKWGKKESEKETQSKGCNVLEYHTAKLECFEQMYHQDK